jgi:hypothetical protein
MTAGVLLGLLLLPPLLLVIERELNRRDEQIDQRRHQAEAERWRRPAIDGVETFMFASDAITRQLNDFVIDRAAKIPGPGAGDLAGHLLRIASDEPRWFDELYGFLQNAANRLGGLAVAMTPTIALYVPLGRYVDDLSVQLRLLRDIAESARMVSFLGADPDPRAQRRVRHAADRIASLAFERMHTLIALKIDLE